MTADELREAEHAMTTTFPTIEDVQAALAVAGFTTTAAEVASVMCNLYDPEALMNWGEDYMDAFLAVPGVDPDGYIRDRLNAARDGYEWS